MKIYFQLAVTLLIIFYFASCSSNNSKNFDLQVQQDSTEIIKPFVSANIMPYYKDGKWGYANKQGDIVIPCKYESCGFFFDGMAWVQKDSKFGYIDTTGHIIITPHYTYAENFIGGFAIVQRDKYCGIIDKMNKTRISFEYERLVNLNNDLICFEQNHQWGILSISKGHLMNPIYDEAFVFNKGFAIVKRQWKYGVINSKNQEVVICNYYSMQQTKGNYFIAQNRERSNDYFGVVDSTGKIIIPIEQIKVTECFNNTFIVENAAGTLLINSKKDTLIKKGFSKIDFGNSNLLAASNYRGHGYINIKGDTIIPFQYSDTKGFMGKFAIAKKGGFYGIINTKTEAIVPFQFKEIEFADKDIVKVYAQDDKYGFYSTNGNKLTECIYDDIDYSLRPSERYQLNSENNGSRFGKFKNNFAIVGVNGRLGVIDKSGKEIFKPYYHEISDFDHNGIAIASYNGAKGLISNKGKVLTEIKYQNIEKDESTGYYFVRYIDNHDRENKINFIIGYFNLDGKYFSNATLQTKTVEDEEADILAIRKEYQYLVSVAAKDKVKSVKIDDATNASMTVNRLLVNIHGKQLNYEFYYSKSLNAEGPFFVFKTDKSSGEAKSDRFYFKNGKLIRWIDPSGKKQIVANGEYSPEDIEHFNGRYYQAAFSNALLLKNNPRTKEIEQIDQWVAKIDTDIKNGKYKKGDTNESSEGEGYDRHNEYVDAQGQFIFKSDESGGEYSTSSASEYYKNGKIIFSTEEETRYPFFPGEGESGLGGSGYSIKTYVFKDGLQRSYKIEKYRNGDIPVITDY